MPLYFKELLMLIKAEINVEDWLYKKIPKGTYINKETGEEITLLEDDGYWVSSRIFDCINYILTLIKFSVSKS